MAGFPHASEFKGGFSVETWVNTHGQIIESNLRLHRMHWVRDLKSDEERNAVFAYFSDRGYLVSKEKDIYGEENGELLIKLP